MPTFTVPSSSQPPATDLSSQLMEALFGNNWWDLQAGTDGLAPLLYHMLGSLNIICLTFIASYMSYVVVVEALGTGAEGKVGGKNDIMWTPLRMGYSIFMSAPVTTIGASIGQVVLLSAVGLSINAANGLWNSSLDFFQETGMTSIVAQVPPTLHDEINDASKAIFAVQVVQAYADRKFKSDAIGIEYKFIPEQDGIWDKVSSLWEEEGGEKPQRGTHVLSYKLPSKTALPEGALGSIRLEGEKNDPVQLARIKGLQAAYNLIKPYSVSVADKIQPKAGFLHLAENAYEAAVAPELARIGTTYSDTEVMKNIKSFATEAKTLGWLAAGSYTMKLARLQEKVNDQLFDKPDIVYPNYEMVVQRLTDPNYNGLKDVINIADTTLKVETYGDFEGSKQIGTEDDTSWYMDILWVLRGRFAFDLFASNLSRQDPMLFLSNFGSNLLDGTITIWGLSTAFSSSLGVAKGAADSFFGSLTGAPKAIAGGINKTWEFIMPFLTMGIVALLLVAVTLAYGLPMIPFFYWAHAIAGWVLLVVEALVAIPFWMIGHTISTKHGFAGEKGSGGYLLLLDVMIRPPLLVVGLCFSFAAMTAVGMTLGKLVVLAADNTFTGMFGAGGAAATGLITNLVLSFMICLIFWKVTHMFFTRGVAHLPRNVAKWLGGKGSMTQAEQEAQNTGNMFVAGVQKFTPRNPALGGGGKGKGGSKPGGNKPKESGDHVQGQTGAGGEDNGGV